MTVTVVRLRKRKKVDYFDILWAHSKEVYERTGFWIIGGGACMSNPAGRRHDAADFNAYKRAMGWN